MSNNRALSATVRGLERGVYESQYTPKPGTRMGGLRLQGWVKKRTDLPLVTVIVATFNAGKRLEHVISSVLSQTYDAIELIIIDGGSTDQTLALLNQYSDRISLWISEPDKGISDAFNKGVLLAQGDYINFQGADDYFIKPTAVAEMMKDIHPDQDTLVCGQIRRIQEDGKSLYETNPLFKSSMLLWRMALPHQALFTHKRFFEKVGLFDTSIKLAMDYDLLLRAYKQGFPKTVMKSVVVSAWREGGIGHKELLRVYAVYHAMKKANAVAALPILWGINAIIHIKFAVKKVLLALGMRPVLKQLGFKL